MEFNKTIYKSSFWDFKGEVDYVDKWFLMESPVPVMLIWIFYIIFVTKLGPYLMNSRKPFDLKNTLLVYNAVQTLISAYLFQIGMRFLWQHGMIATLCFGAKEDTLQYITTGTHLYFTAKVTELLDTIFFVLRKKYNQVTFLHVFHHSAMMLNTWLILKYNPTDVLIFIGTLNSFVHIVMYTYYGLTIFPELKKFLWWKKYLTSLQLVQFGVIAVHVAINMAYSECPLSKVLMFTIFLHLILFIYLFGDFYVKSYTKSDAKKKMVIRNGKYAKETDETCVNNRTIDEEYSNSDGLNKIASKCTADIIVRNCYSKSKLHSVELKKRL